MKKHVLLIAFLVSLISFSPVNSQELVEAEMLATLSSTTISFLLGGLAIPENGVTLYKILYTTPDAQGQLDTASGLLGVPVVEGTRPLIAYQHGTVDGPDDVVSNREAADETIVIAYAALGFITSATDYIGLGESRGFHPYVHDRTQAQAGIDMMIASLTFIESLENITWNDQIFVSGYSQGGHAAMGMHRLLQNEYGDQYTVTASTPMSGPYNVSGVMRELIESEEPYGTAAYIPYVVLGYQAVYGDLFETLDEVFLEPYLTEIQKFWNREILLSDLNTFLVNALVEQEGASIPKRMMVEEYYNAFATDPNHVLRGYLRDNDNHNWKADAPVRLFYCEADEQVPFMNAIVANDTMNALGSTDVQAISVGVGLSHGQCVVPALLNSLDFFKSMVVVSSTEIVEDLEGVIVGPNPVSDFLTIRSDNAIDLDHVSITGMTGQQYYMFADPRPSDLTIDVGSLPPGMYVLTLSGEGKSSVSKISVIR